MSYEIGPPKKLRKKQRIRQKRNSCKNLPPEMRLAIQQEWQKLHDAGVVMEDCIADRFASVFNHTALFLRHITTPQQVADHVRNEWNFTMGSDHEIYTARQNVDMLAMLAAIRCRNRKNK